MGTVFHAEHVVTGQRVALKIPHPGVGDKIAQQRFLREVRLSAKLHHDNIVRVLDAGRDNELNVLYVAMELLQGVDLESRLEQPTSRRDALTWVKEMLGALSVAHDAGIVHRDLKPGNLFLAQGRDGVERIKLLDFGIARNPGGSSVTQDGMVIGTPDYMSPEQAFDPQKVDHRSDLWSVGVLLYETLTGNTPFPDESIHAIVMRAAAEPHQPVDTVVSGVDPRLAQLVDQCLAKSPEDRPASAEAIAALLEVILGDEAAATWLDEDVPVASVSPSGSDRPYHELAASAHASIRTGGTAERGSRARGGSAPRKGGRLHDAAVAATLEAEGMADEDAYRVPTQRRVLWLIPAVAFLGVGVAVFGFRGVGEPSEADATGLTPDTPAEGPPIATRQATSVTAEGPSEGAEVAESPSAQAETEAAPEPPEENAAAEPEHGASPSLGAGDNTAPQPNRGEATQRRSNDRTRRSLEDLARAAAAQTENDPAPTVPEATAVIVEPEDPPGAPDESAEPAETTTEIAASEGDATERTAPTSESDAPAPAQASDPPPADEPPPSTTAPNPPARPDPPDPPPAAPVERPEPAPTMEEEPPPFTF